MKKALASGVTGQDVSNLVELLLLKGYEAHGIKRRASLFNTRRIDHLYQNPHPAHPRLILHYGDLGNTSSLTRIVQQVQPDKIYHLGAMRHVAVSFETPGYPADINGIRTLRLPEAVRFLRLEHKIRFYQASTSEPHGLARETPQRESPLSIRAARTQSPGPSPTGSRSITAKRMGSMPAAASCSTTPMVHDMVAHDLDTARHHKLIALHGYKRALSLE